MSAVNRPDRDCTSTSRRFDTIFACIYVHLHKDSQLLDRTAVALVVRDTEQDAPADNALVFRRRHRRHVVIAYHAVAPRRFRRVVLFSHGGVVPHRRCVVVENIVFLVRARREIVSPACGGKKSVDARRRPPRDAARPRAKASVVVQDPRASGSIHLHGDGGGGGGGNRRQRRRRLRRLRWRVSPVVRRRGRKWSR